jgi:mono/diheme cytochrome c family protein
LIATGIGDPREEFSKCRCTEHNSHLKRNASIFTVLLFLALLAGCGKDPELQTDAELGLNLQQAEGRRVYKLDCAVCHSAYTSKGSKGPSMKGIYKRPYLPSGLIANDQFVEQSILHGRNMMPGFGNSLTQQQLDDLIAYLHTL